MSGDDRARAAAALRALEALIARAPPPDQDGAREVFEALSALRDGMLARRRRDGGAPALDADLARVNAAIALAWSGAMPVAGFRAGRLEKARALLDGLAEG
jgi:hypothetical protein